MVILPATSAEREDLRTTWRWILMAGVLAWCGFVFFFGLGWADLFRSEAMRAQMGREMLASGDSVVPTFYDRPLVTKPPGMYIAVALAAQVRGGEVDEWTARLPGALGGVALCVLGMWLIGRQFGWRAGAMTAVMLAGSWTFFTHMSTAEIDGFFTFWVGAAVLLILQDPDARGRPPWGWTAAAYVCLAVAMLTKGPAALMVFYAMLVPLAIVQRRPAVLLNLRHAAGLILVLGLIGGWGLLAAERVGLETMKRTSSGEVAERIVFTDWRHLLEAIVHPLKLAGIYLPVSLLALWAVHRPWREAVATEGPRTHVLQGLICCILGSVVILSVLPLHATRYSMPVFPAVAALAAIGLGAWWGREHATLGRTMERGLAVVLVVLAVVVAGAGAVALSGWIAGVERWPGFLLLPAAVIAVGGAAMAWRGRRSAVVLALLVAIGGLKIAEAGVLLPARDARQDAPRLGRAIAERLEHEPGPERPVLIFHRWHEVAIFYMGHPVRWIELEEAEAPAIALVSPEEHEALAERFAVELLAEWPGGVRSSTEIVRLVRLEARSAQDHLLAAPAGAGGGPGL